MTTDPPPINEQLSDANGLPTLPWTLFFNQSYIGDTGAIWEPEFTGLATSGDPTITGRYYKISQELCYFHVHIVPGTSTSATAGTTYVNNFPLQVSRNGICFAVSGLLGSSSGQVEEGTSRIYVPGWSTVTVPLTIVGLAEAK